jgi:hypothetical protein
MGEISKRSAYLLRSSRLSWGTQLSQKGRGYICSRTMGDRAQGFLALWTQELFSRPCWSVTANLDSISARGDFVCMGCLGVCVLAGIGRKMAADRWGYAAPHWWGMEGKEAVVFGDLRRKLKRRSRGNDKKKTKNDQN